jgi:preprotein translocase subunit SecF
MSRLSEVGGRLYRGEVSFDFVGRKKLWYTISGAILAISLAALLIFGLNYTVDFKGGNIYKFTTPQTVQLTQTEVTDTAINAGAPPTTIVTRVGSNGWNVQTEALKGKSGNKVEGNILRALAKEGQVSPNAVSLQAVGPSWGGQISDKALQALIAFLIVIVIYLSIAFEWRMAAAALVALAHDIVITVGVYALTRFEVSPATVIGLLTILGYSLYDTVVVFDKVRENTAGLLAVRKTRYSDAANLALNQTLVRSINTSLIALLPVVAILIVSVTILGGGEELQDLSLVLFVGMLSGTYSSICIATPVLADLKERQPEYRQLAKQIAQRATSTKRQAKVTATGATASASVAVAEGEPASSATGGRVALAEGTAPEVEPTDDELDDQSAATVSAGRPGGSSSGTRASVGPRQQPRRSSASSRRPSGKKKRR